MLPGRRRGGQLDLTTVPAHPLFTSAYFVLYLFAGNLEDQLTLGPLWYPLLTAIAAAAAAVVVSSLLLRDVRRGALLATLFLVLFFTFGHAWTLVQDQLSSRGLLAAAYVAIGAAAAWLIWRGGTWVVPMTRFLNVALGILVVVNALPIATAATEDPTAGLPMPTPVVTPSAESDDPPDIYYLIFDRYANADTLESVYGYDNTPFLDELRGRGFYVAESAWANYFKTAFSLASSLDMEFLSGDELQADSEPDREMRPIHTMVNGPLTGPVTLQSLGYEYVHIGSWFAPTTTNTTADVTLNYSDDLEFRTALSETTALSLLGQPGASSDGRNISDPAVARAYHEYNFRQVAAAADRSGPTFVFAHFLLPHPPYVYDADGGLPDLEDGRDSDARYIDQLQYTNDQILEAIDAIRTRSEEEPVIILQADEGPFPQAYAQNERGFDWLEATPEEVAHKFGILYAAALPGVDPEEAGLHERSTPVNALRIVANAYLGADLPLLPDTIYLSPSHARPYDFVAIERDSAGMPVLP